MFSFLDLLEYFNNYNGLIYTTENISIGDICIKHVNFNVLDLNNNVIQFNDLRSNPRARIFAEIDAINKLSVSSKVFTHKKAIIALEYNIENKISAEFQQLIDNFLAKIKCEKIMYELYTRDISEFNYGFADCKLFVISKYDKEILNVIEYNEISDKIIFRDYGFGYNHTLGLILQNYIEFCAQKLIYEFEFNAQSNPIFSVKTYLSGRIMDSEYTKYSHKYFFDLFTNIATDEN